MIVKGNTLTSGISTAPISSAIGVSRSGANFSVEDIMNGSPPLHISKDSDNSNLLTPGIYDKRNAIQTGSTAKPKTVNTGSTGNTGTIGNTGSGGTGGSSVLPLSPGDPQNGSDTNIYITGGSGGTSSGTPTQAGFTSGLDNTTVMLIIGAVVLFLLLNKS